jgi:hypothetical protein
MRWPTPLSNNQRCGVKASGLGSELGPEGMQAYLQPKTVYLAPTAAQGTYRRAPMTWTRGR